MVKYSRANVNLIDAQLKKLKNAVENNAETTLRKMCDGNDLSH